MSTDDKITSIENIKTVLTVDTVLTLYWHCVDNKILKIYTVLILC